MRLSFTSSSDTPRSIRRLVMACLAAAILLVACDLLGALTIHWLTREPPELLPIMTDSVGIDAFWTQTGAGLSPVAFTGSSQTVFGISPHSFEDETAALLGQAVPAANLGIPTSDTVMVGDLIRSLILPESPRAVIWGIEMRQLNSPAMQWEGLFRDSALGYALSLSPGLEQTTQLWLLRHSTLVRYRYNVRDWLTGLRPKDVIVGPPDDLGFTGIVHPYVKDTSNISQFVPFSPPDPLSVAVTDIGLACQQRSIPCIVINMPLHPDIYEYITPQQEAQYQALLHQITSRGHLQVWDFNTPACRQQLLALNAYFDINHLNKHGAELFSQALAVVYVREVLHRSIEPALAAGLAQCAQVVSQ